MRNANYEIVEKNMDYLIIKDKGPWSVFMTITNAAEQVVNELLPRLNGRKLYYYDSAGSLGELRIKDNKFHSFGFRGPE